MKKLISLLLCLAFTLSLSGCNMKTIGSMKGAEWKIIEIDNIEYVRVMDSGVTVKDRGDYLGIVSDGKTVFRCYSVKNDKDGRYLYCFWDWEGRVYERAS